MERPSDRLWHNITILLEGFASDPSNAEYLIGLYDK